MSVQLDETLLYRHRRKPREDALTKEDLIAVNLFWRRGVKVTVLAKVFHASKNTLYARALTGAVDTNPNSLYANQAREINELVTHMGEEAAWKRYVSDDMVRAVNEGMRDDVERRDAAA